MGLSGLPVIFDLPQPLAIRRADEFAKRFPKNGFASPDAKRRHEASQGIANRRHEHIQGGLDRMQASTAQLLFWIYAAVMGLSLGGIFLVYTGTSIARVFFITAATYGAMSLYGYTTKTDLSGFGSFLLMGLIGIIIASLVNLFIGSNTLQFVISIIGVIVFVGLTAYDTQRIKEMYLESDTAEVADKKAVLGALALYLDFINLFMMLLQLFGQRREN